MQISLARLAPRFICALALFAGGAACAQEPAPDPTPPGDAAAQEGTVEADGVSLHYRLFGNIETDATPLLVLNGGPGLSSEHFGGLAARLSEVGGDRLAITFDQRGTGRSPLDRVDTSTVNVAVMVEDIEALRTHLGIDEWVVFGHSWGGMYAMAYAAAHPDRARGLILSASGGSDLAWTDGFQTDLRNRLKPEEREAFDRASTQQERVEAMAPAYVYHDENIPFVVEALSRPGASNATVRSLVFQDLFAMEFDMRDDLARFEAPALILHGQQDILGVEVPTRTHEALPTSELVLVDECSHYLWLDQPETYFGAIGTFLREETGA